MGYGYDESDSFIDNSESGEYLMKPLKPQKCVTQAPLTVPWSWGGGSGCALSVERAAPEGTGSDTLIWALVPSPNMVIRSVQNTS